MGLGAFLRHLLAELCLRVLVALAARLALEKRVALEKTRNQWGKFLDSFAGFTYCRRSRGDWRRGRRGGRARRSVGRGFLHIQRNKFRFRKFSLHFPFTFLASACAAFACFVVGSVAADTCGRIFLSAGEIYHFPQVFLTVSAAPGIAAAMAAAPAAVFSPPVGSTVWAVSPRVLRFFFGGLGL